MMKFDPNQKSMHPSDKRNLIIFVVLTLLIWWAFERYVIQPRLKHVEEQQQLAEANAPKAAKPVDPAEAVLPRDERLAQTKRLTISSPEIAGTLPLVGNRIDDITLKNFFTDLDNKNRVVLMSPAGTNLPLYAEAGWLSGDTTVRVPDKDTNWTVKGNDNLTADTPVTLEWSNGAGLTFQRVVSIDKHFLLTVTQKVKNTSGKDVDLYPYTTLTRRGLPTDHGKGTGYEGPLGYIADTLQEIPYHDLATEGAQKFSGLNGWIGFGEKYWLSAILPEQMKQTSFNFQAVPNEDPAKAIYQVDARGDKMTVASGSEAESVVRLFIGAKTMKILDTYEDELNVKHFDLAIDFGWLYFLTKPLYVTLIFFHGLVGNFGIAIILLTFVVRGAVYPLASKSYRSFAGLKKISPKMAEIKARYGDDKRRLQQEIMKLYETEQVNPMAGCFPLLLQMPIFFAIYRVMSIAVEMRHAPFFGWIHDLSAPDPLTVFNLFGLLPYDVPTFLMIGPWSLAMLFIMIFQKHLNPPPQEQIQRDIMNWMPYIMTYTLANFPSGLVIYWAFSNLLSVIQQAVIMRSMGVPIYLIDKEAAIEHSEQHTRATAEVVERVKREKEETSKGKE